MVIITSMESNLNTMFPFSETDFYNTAAEMIENVKRIIEKNSYMNCPNNQLTQNLTF
jgi:hypothetical protein